jgi:ABC-type nitrate/sulfonate/bicarbonate transport system substrate-binding protein
MNYEPIEIRGYFRAYSHLPIWEVLDKAGVWEEVGIKMRGMEFCASPPEAEGALFEGKIDFISGNHITPYSLVGEGKPIVCIASPSNQVRDRLVSREKFSSLAELRGKKIVDLAFEGRVAGFNHLRGNHALYIIRAGLKFSDVKWLEIGEDITPAFRKEQFEMLTSGKADAALITGGTAQYEEAGLNVLPLDPLPMINGPTMTTATTALKRKDRLGERMVKALVMGIHYAKTHRDETEKILEGLRKRESEAGSVRYESLSRMPIKPYPTMEAIGNAYELCLMKIPEAKNYSPVSLWDLHYLRELDDSGFIDGLYK